MKKIIFLLAILMLGTSAFSQEINRKRKRVRHHPVFDSTATASTKKDIIKTKSTNMSNSIYSFKVKDINGKIFDFASLKGKKIMIVNTASECGFTPQYKQLQEIYAQYKTKNFVVIGFPTDNFGGQEPGSNSEIATFCSKNYGVSFPMMEKISVKGDEVHPLYQYLTKKALNGLSDNEVQWNFQKYLIDTKGKLVRVVLSTITPDDESIINWIKS
jgi:glutathione peroxidase